MIKKPDICSACPINRATGDAFVPLTLKQGTTLLVGEAPGEDEARQGEAFVGASGAWLNNMLRVAGIRRENISTTNTICCRPPENIYPLDKKWRWTSKQDARDGVEYCRKHFLEKALNERDWKKIYAVGDHSLTSLTPRRGILIWRGSPLPLKGRLDHNRVLPILHPSYLMRDAKMVSTTVHDLKKRLDVPPENYNLFANSRDLSKFRSTVLAFDFEWDYFGDITLCGISDKFYHATTGSWFGDNVQEFKRIFEEATDLIGHNIIGADMKMFARMKWDIKARLHDTMLKHHLVQPDMKHGLGQVGTIFTNKPFWKGRGKEEEDEEGNIIDTKEQWKTWRTDEAIPRELGGYGGCISDDEAYRLYNARDTDASFQINTHLDQLLKKYDLEKVYWNVSVPIAFICRGINDHGIRINPDKLKVIRDEILVKIAKLEDTLPDGLRPYEKPINKQIPAPQGTFKTKTVKCRGTKKAGTIHEPTSWETNKPGESWCPVCGRGFHTKNVEVKKIKVASSKRVTPYTSNTTLQAFARGKDLKIPINRKTGNTSADVKARKVWARSEVAFQIVNELKKLTTMRSNFTKEKMLGIDRLYFELLTHGTSEGRFSAKGKREGIDPNIQQQPPFIKKIYIPDQPNYSFLELDYASGENMLTAFLAKDWQRLERLNQPGYSEHLELAKQIFNLPSSITKKECQDYNGQDLYGVGKILNHGGNYGMTYKKVREELETEGFFYTEADCKEFVNARKKLNPRTTAWQDETISMAKRDGFLRNPFGRMRWFSTRDIATKSLAFLPASTLADIIIRAMIAHYPDKWSNECRELGLERLGGFMPGWFLNIQVHDSLVLQGPSEDWIKQAEITRAVMTQPWKELDGFKLDVEIKVGGPGESWGDLKVAHI